MRALERQPACHPSWCSCTSCKPPMLRTRSAARERRAMALSVVITALVLIALINL